MAAPIRLDVLGLVVVTFLGAAELPAGRLLSAFLEPVVLAQSPQVGQIPGAPAPGQTPLGTSPPPPPPGPGQPKDKKDSKVPEAPLSFFPIQTKWSVDLGAPPSAPAAFDAERAYVPLQSGQMVAVDIERGVTTWTQPAATRLAPAADKGRVFVVSETELSALDAADGRALWRVPLTSPAVRAPVTRGGWVILSLESGELLALRADDGKTMWTVMQDSPATIDPIIEGDRVLVTSARGLVSLDVLSGRKHWERPLDGRATAAGRAHDVTYVGTAGRWFYAVDERSGRVRWRWRVAGEPIGVVADEQVAVVLMLDHTIRAFKVGNGAQAWREALLYRPFAGPVRAAGVLLVAGHGAAVRAYKDSDGTGAGVWALPTPAATEGIEQLDALAGMPHVRIGPTIVDDLLVVVTQRGTLHGARHQFMPDLTPVTYRGEPVPIPGVPDAFQPAVTIVAPAQLPGVLLTVPGPPPPAPSSSRL